MDRKTKSCFVFLIIASRCRCHGTLKCLVLQDSSIPFDEDRFRFHSYEEFEANWELKGDLYGKLSNF